MTVGTVAAAEQRFPDVLEAELERTGDTVTLEVPRDDR